MLTVEEVKKKLNLTYEIGSVEYYEDIIDRAVEIQCIVRMWHSAMTFPSDHDKALFEADMNAHIENMASLIEWAESKIVKLKSTKN